MRYPAPLLALAAWVAAIVNPGCTRHAEPGQDAGLAVSPTGSALRDGGDAGREPRDLLSRPLRLANRVAYIPPQCFTKTRAEGDGDAKNPCYACHTRSEPPNYANDQDLQLTLSLPPPAKQNPWTNLFDPPLLHVARPSQQEILAYVRSTNYFDEQGNILLAKALGALPAEWDTNGNGKWDGFTPDMWLRFDDRGFDHRPDGSLSGWRAFAYYPFHGTFFPTNGSTDDVAIRLDDALQKDKDGRLDGATYELNLAIVEALIRRTDVVIDPVDETALGVDLDLNGRLGWATKVAFDAAADRSGRTRMHYVGLAREREKTSFFPIAPGLFPIGTEFFHTVRYLDVGPDGAVTMSARMKEVRYAKKVRWASYEIARANAAREAQEQADSSDGTHTVHWDGERGVFTRTWLFQGFIENRDGSLRPQTFEEMAFCEGCHAGIGATTDETFSFARKIDGAGLSRGWFHWSQHDFRGIAEPKRADGEYAYTFYLRQAGAGDELRENTEVTERFFDDRHELRPAETAHLHRDIAYLLLPSPERALELDRAYRAIVLAQSFDKGRDAILARARNVYSDVPLGQSTGVPKSLVSDSIVPTANLPTSVMRTSPKTRVVVGR